jgi:hypothetical protein
MESSAHSDKADQLAFKRHVRSIWISDVHLGFSGCSADHLLKFLRRMRCDKLYLVGEIVDLWELKIRVDSV